MTKSHAIDKILAEAEASERRYGEYNSPHEAFGVLMEEVAELQVEIQAQCWNTARAEAIQIAAVALRFVAGPTVLERKGIL